LSEDYDITKSAKELGKLVPILKDAHGNIIDGFHRIEVDPNWPSIKVESVDDAVKLELARLATNFCRRQVTPDEMKRRIGFLVESGMSPEGIVEKTGISISTVYRHMPQELKDHKKSEVGGIRKSSDSAVTCEQTVKIHETPQQLKEPDCNPTVPPALTIPVPFVSPVKATSIEPEGRKPSPTEFLETVKCPYCGNRFVPPKKEEV
jgi:hypothetical protein